MYDSTHKHTKRRKAHLKNKQTNKQTKTTKLQINNKKKTIKKKCTCNSYRADVEQKDGGIFNWTTQVWLFLEQGYINYGDLNDTTVSVLRGSMKFALEIEGYNFTSMDNVLRINCRVDAHGDGSGTEVMQPPFSNHFFFFSVFFSVFVCVCFCVFFFCFRKSKSVMRPQPNNKG